MDSVILISILSLSAIAGISAVILFWVSKKFKVEEDPRIDQVEEILPGANCGGCGYPGCRGFAEALVNAADKGDLAGYGCPPGGNDTMKEVGKTLGMEVEETAPKVAVLKCNGSYTNASIKLDYNGPKKCSIQHNLFSGENGCAYGCMGCGDCVVVCDFDAIKIDSETGLPVVDQDKCVACDACVKACPRNILELRLKGRKNRRVWIACKNQEKGGPARKNCKTACIGCKKCEIACPDKVSAITVENNLAYIDSDKCIACGKCITECPTNAILATFIPVQLKKKMKEEAEKKSEVKK